MFKIPEKIFSIKEYNEIRYKITILGIKISFPKSTIRKQLKENVYNYYKKNKLDITTVPKATGQIRDIQLANLALFKELYSVCKKNNLHCWIDYGSLIGAIRHKGFIPWDDDIDVGMIRDDYNKLQEVFENSKENPDIYLTKTFGFEKQAYLLRVRHHKCSSLFVDIFPYDYYGKQLTQKERLKVTKEIKNYRKKHVQNYEHTTDGDKIVEKLASAQKAVLIRDESFNPEKSDIVWGIEYCERYDNWFFDYDTIFPLKTIEFENMEVECINKPDIFLKRLYGNYMNYPKKISAGHNAYKILSDEHKEVIQQLAKETK